MNLFGMEIPPTPKPFRPITPRENWKLAIAGKKPYWIPSASWFGGEMVQFRPRINPDNVANHQVFDGGPAFDYGPQGDVVKSDFFGVIYHFIQEIGGATVEPNELVIKDIEHWQDYVKIPDLSKLDWKTCETQNVGYLGTDRMNSLGIQFGLWERLMNMVGVVESCIALCDEEQKPAVHSFLGALADWYEDYIGRMKAICNIDGVTLHDDWCHQTGPFFSPDTAREMIQPYIKRVVESCHKRGMYYDVHLCGKVDKILDVFIEAGCDMWMGQADLNDIDMLVDKFQKERFLIGVPAPSFEESATETEIRKSAEAFVEKYKDRHIFLVPSFIMSPGNTIFESAVYEFSRQAYESYSDTLAE
jgi:hypothetical protein